MEGVLNDDPLACAAHSSLRRCRPFALVKLFSKEFEDRRPSVDLLLLIEKWLPPEFQVDADRRNPEVVGR